MKIVLLILFLTSIFPALGQGPISLSSETFLYPDEALEKGIQGKVYVKFTALPNGHILDSTVVAVKGLGYGLDEIAVVAVKDAPPLERNAVTRLKKNESTDYVLPIVFRITHADWSEYYLRKSKAHLARKNIEGALKDLKLSLEFNEGNASAYFALYEIYKDQGDAKLACKNLKKAKKYDKSYSEQWRSECK